MRTVAPGISLNTEIGFEEDLMRQVISGTMDLALMYSPLQGAGLQVEHLFDETLILVASGPVQDTPNDGYVYVDGDPPSTPSTARSIPTWIDPRKKPTSAGLAFN